MKILKLIGMTISVVVMSVNFTSCSNNDEPDIPINTAKKLVECSEDGDITHWFYNSNGKINRIRYDGSFLNIQYGNETVTEIWEDSGEPEYTYYIDELLRSYKDNQGNLHTCTYDSDGNLIQAGNVKITWENGNIVNCTDEHETIHFAYDINNINQHHSWLSDPLYFIFETPFFAAYPELLGNKCRNLVKSYEVISSHDSYKGSYTYEIDTEGYVVKITDKMEDYDTPEITTLTWE